MTTKQIITQLRKHSSKENKQGMARFGIDIERALGVKIPILRQIAKEIDKNSTAKDKPTFPKAKADKHKLARELWKTNIHEAMILASMIDEPEKVTKKQMEQWVKKFTSWDLCDQCCMNLFDKTRFWEKKAIQWSKNEKEFIKRAGFTLMATSAFHCKNIDDKTFLKFLPIIKRELTDKRNFVKKAINWALRQIGKRNLNLNKQTIKFAKQIKKDFKDNKTVQWIVNDAIRELTNETIQKKLK